jgi:hypothetical protein
LKKFSFVGVSMMKDRKRERCIHDISDQPTSVGLQLYTGSQAGRQAAVVKRDEIEEEERNCSLIKS